MAWQRKAKKEIGDGWRWMRQQNPDAAKEAELWAEQNAEEMKEVDRMLYRSDERYHGKTSNLHAEAAHSIANSKKQFGADLFLSRDERDRIYGDHVYIPNEYYREGTDDDDMIRLPTELADSMRELTDLQREVIIRNVINRESASVIAGEKNCSARNIRDIRGRALKVLRTAMTKGQPGLGYPDTVLFILWSIQLVAVAAVLLVPDALDAWMRTAMFIALPIVTVAAVIRIVALIRKSPLYRVRSFFKKK